MLALLLNTAGEQGIVALVENGLILRQIHLPARGTGEALMPAIRQVLGERKVSTLDAIGVVLGPGSFTGTRVGLAAAKGLCEAGQVGMIGMSRLALLGPTALLNAGRGEFYSLCAGRERLIGVEEACTLNGVTSEPHVAESLAMVELIDEPGAEAMWAEVVCRAAASEWTDVADADANYIRRTDAELKTKTY